HGGQVIVSDATRGLVQHALPAGVSLRDLGPHHLRGIEDPEGLHQLVVDGLPADFPPPRTLDARPSNLPPQLTSFVGREEEIAEVERLVDHTRLLTPTCSPSRGPGGRASRGWPCGSPPTCSPATRTAPGSSTCPR